MNVCKYCGNNLNEDDVFCTACGKRVNEDNVNTSPKFLKYGALDYVAKLISRPFTTACKFIDEGQKDSAMIVTIVAIVLQGLLGIWKSNQIVSQLSGLIYTIIDKIRSTSILFGKNMPEMSPDEMRELQQHIMSIKNVMDVPYGKIFFQNCILIITAIIILFISLFLIYNLINKEKVDSFNIYKISIISVFPFIFMEILSVLVSYINNTIGIFVLIVGIAITISILTLLIRNYLLQSGDVAVYVVPIISTIVVFIILIILGSFVRKNLQDLILNLTTLLKNLHI
ncbi:zinc ribbon domain-containing protein [Clostridium sp. KNHs214]|uniref:zinc ribbon domain-containing protein n=1 Tax=Clostridium sp. KNHs214 TaxID=1540257 RepID=UPI0005506ED0|nr:zinc ribbon domain-containing protein [Clostridium sp. KNHs214]